MLKQCSFILFFLPYLCFAQENLVFNYSLEHWEKTKPAGWIIEKNTVDFFKTDYKLVPFGVSVTDFDWRSRFPKKGSQGISYVGLAGNEIASADLGSSLDSSSLYELSIHVYNPPIYSDGKTNKFTVRFENQEGNLSKAIVLKSDFEIDTVSKRWHRVSKIISGNNNEKRIHIGFFGDNYMNRKHNVLNLYYLFDELAIRKLCKKQDTITLKYQTGKYKVDEKDLDVIFKDFNRPEYYNLNAEIKGYASAEGEFIDNYELSKKRCEYIKSYLNNKENIKINHVIALGEKASTIPFNSKDRKVEIILSYTSYCQPPQSYEAPSKFNLALQNELKKIIDDDQSIRMRFDSLSRSSSPDSSIIKQVINEMIFIDSMNIEKITSIINNYGYPGISMVGAEYMDATFLLFQHANLQLRLKYESTLKQAISEGEATKKWLPYMVDRNLVDQGKKQIYGTQFFFNEVTNRYELFEIENKAEVDKIRAKFRMSKLADYVDLMNSGL